MNPLHLLLILRAHWKVAFGVFLFTLVVGITVTLLMPKQYVTSTSLVFDVKSSDPVAGAFLPVVPGYLQTQVDIIKSDHIAQQVVTALKLDQSPTLKRRWQDETGGKTNLQYWIGELLQKGLMVSISNGTNIISISFAAGDPSFAAAVANAYAQAYIITNIELKVDPARQYSRWFGDQAKVMRENLEKAQAALSEYQQEHGIVSKEEHLDTEMARLNELTAQLTQAQEQAVEVRSKQNAKSDELPDVNQSSMVQSLKTDIARQEAKLQEAGENLGVNHPQYQRMAAELATLKAQLQSEKNAIVSSLSTSKNIALSKESQLRAAIESQKKKLLELKGGRDRLAVLQRDVDAAQSAYDTVIKRYNQTSLESQVTQTNVSVLNPAIQPPEPASPNIKKSLAMTLLLALILGGGAAYLLELLDKKVRTVDDLVEMLQVPVLAVIEGPRRSNRLVEIARQQLLRLESK
ncbi:MAG: chain length determinant protein EpsF [Proteobacteria bacterium]|nr:chain length determinant protein EpsF [Pseudomonadota bacterium]HQR03419.1 chain length determinant protein EpsF [Rhodocyclaceae bacterium]